MTQPPPQGPYYPQGYPQQGYPQQGYPQQGYPPPPPNQARRTPWYRRALPIGIVACLVGIGIGGAAASGSSNKKAAADTSVATPTATVTATATATKTNRVVVHATTTVTGHPRKVIATRTHTMTVTYTPQPKRTFSDGTYLVPQDIRPGLYQTSGGDCYWEKDRDLHGSISSIIDNNNFSGPTTVEITPDTRAFQVSGGCTWHDRVY